MYYIILPFGEFIFSYLRRIITKYTKVYVMLIMDVNTIILNRKIMTAVGTNGEPTVNCNGKKK
jgi:hypothetical protein